MAEEKPSYQRPIYRRKDLSSYYRKLGASADRTVFIVFTGVLFFSFLIAPKYNTWGIALMYGGLSYVVFVLLRLAFPDKTWYRYVASAAFGVISCQIHYQLEGAYQGHFMGLILSVTLIMYQNWKLQVPMVAIVFSYYFVCWALDGSHGFYLSEDGLDNTFQSFLLYFSGAGLVYGVCIFWSIILAKRSRRLNKQLNINERSVELLSKNIAFAEAIAKQEYDTEVEVQEDDAIGKSLLEMRESLKKSNDKESIEKFYTTGLAQISQILRDFDDGFEKVANKLISYLVKYFDANQGGLYLVEENKDGTEFLQLTAFYAWERAKYANQKLAKGEGLVGQAFQEQGTIYMTKVPEDYIRVTSGLGHANPDAILIVPLVVDKKVYGVVELAAFGAFETYKIGFLEKLGESIAVSVANHQNATYTKRLLEESQHLAEQQRAQDEEMRQNMEELQATQEELIRKEKHLNSAMDEQRKVYMEEIAALKATISELRKSEG